MRLFIPLALLSLLITHSAPLIAAPVDVTAPAYGARGDGRTLNTAVLQRAIDDTSTVGGGTIVFPAGRYLTGTLILRSNITLHLDTGAVILGSAQLADYPAQTRVYREGIIEIDGKQVGGYPMRHLLYAKEAENIVLEGQGAIDGNGDSYFSNDKTTAHERPTPLIELIDCRQIRIEGITIRNSPGWTLHPKNCDDVRVRGISILNNLRAINSDGIDVDSSRNVLISDCHIEAGDDCIVLKTTQSLSGETAPVENVTVTNCVLVSAASALKLGTESHGDFRHILFNNCVIRDSRTGLALICRDGGSMQDVRFSDISMTTKPKWGRGYELPIMLELNKRAADSRQGAISDISFNNITLFTKGRIIVRGMNSRQRIENVVFNNITMHVTGYEVYTDKIAIPGGASKSKDSDSNLTASSAIVVSNAKNITLDGFHLNWPAQEKTPPPRNLLKLDTTDTITLRNISATPSTPGLDFITAKDSTNIKQ